MLGLSAPGGFTESVSTVMFPRSILEFVAPNLDELVWDGSMKGIHEGKHSFGSELIRFPKLQDLQITRISIDDTVLPGQGWRRTIDTPVAGSPRQETRVVPRKERSYSDLETS